MSKYPDLETSIPMPHYARMTQEERKKAWGQLADMALQRLAKRKWKQLQKQKQVTYEF